MSLPSSHVVRETIISKVPVLIASLGNPPPTYSNTFHSAGHTLLSSLLSALNHPPLTRSRTLSNGLVSAGPAFTLWQSPSLMNVSGPPLAAAWLSFLRGLPSDEERKAARLVVLHDELESPLGRIKVKVGGSVKGHNGLKSCVKALGTKGFVRVGVGIGRPESREPADVSRYVLRRMRANELEVVTGGVGEVVALLDELSEGAGERKSVY